jgi:hypothetical protein
MRRVIFLALLCIASSEFLNFLQAEAWWEKKPYLQWSDSEVHLIFHKSPWAKDGVSGVIMRQLRAPSQSDRPFESNIEVATKGLPIGNLRISIRYNLFILTALPIREACYRYISLGNPIDSVVDVKDINKTESTEKEKERLARFISENPNSPIVKGEEKYIIIGVTFKPNRPYSVIDVSKVMQATRLRTDTGQSIRLAYFNPAGAFLGLQFYFPKYLPDGQALVNISTKELWFETAIDKLRIRVKFEPKKMLYKGKLEV